MPLDLTTLAPLIQDLVMADTVRITRPGAGTPVLDPVTDVLTPPTGTVVYEGPGAVLSQASMPGLTLPVAGQDWVDDPKNPYRLLTPPDAPLAARDDVVTVVAARFDQALIGRSWRCLRPGQASTMVAVRITWLDENQGGG